MTTKKMMLVALVAVLVFALAQVAMAADTGHRAASAVYNEEGFGLLTPSLPFTEYRPASTVYNEEGFGLLTPSLPFTEYRPASTTYNEEGFGLLR